METIEDTHVLLNESARLRLDEGACLPLRSDFGQCRACESVCPAQVIRVTVEAIVVSDGCLHCGRCVAACPTEALQLDNYIFSVPDGERSAPLEVECAKVPAALRAKDAVEVPCLGALSPGRLAQLHEAAGALGVVLVDRGWCPSCAAGCCDAHPVAAALEQVEMWLEAVGDPWPAPRLEHRPLPQALMPEQIPLPPAPEEEGPKLTRRQFFRRLLEDPLNRRQNVTPMGGSGRAAFPASRRRESPERRRLLEALEKAAARANSTLPDELFPRVTTTGACVDHRVCVAACPTGALKVFESDGAVSLTFSATACIGCGACQRSCPEGALIVEPYGGGDRSPVVIAEHKQRTCSSCGEVFTPREGETLCLSCSKAQRFLGDAMAKLFGGASR